MVLQHKVLLELKRKIPVQFDLNREITVQFSTHFMLQYHEGVFSLFIQFFFLECTVELVTLTSLKLSHSELKCNVLN